MTVAVGAKSQKPSDEDTVLQESSKEYLDGRNDATKTLDNQHYFDGLISPSLGSVSTGRFDAILREIKATGNIADKPEPAGDRGVTYDVIIQPGHHERIANRTGTAGKFVTEQEFVAYISLHIARILRQQGISVLVIPADNFLRPTPKKIPFDGLKSKVFLAIHAEGAVACKGHPSLGYADNSSVLGMYYIASALSRSMGYTPTDYAPDNFTANVRKFYMWPMIQSSTMKGLLEVGELTCEDQERKLIASSPEIAKNIAHALQFMVKL